MRAFSKRQTRLQKQISSFLHSDIHYSLRVVRSTELTGLVRYEHAVKLDDNITVNAVQVGDRYIYFPLINIVFLIIPLVLG